MDRRTLIAAGLVSLSAYPAFAQTDPVPPEDRPENQPGNEPGNEPPEEAPPAEARRPDARPEEAPPPAEDEARTYSADEMISAASDFMGVTAEAAGGAIERIFRENGRPTAYIAGEEGSGAIGIGLRYGRGLLYMKGHDGQEVKWQGPSVGWDFGGNASRVFTLCYNLQYPDAIFRRFPGVEGAAYLIGGLGVNYQKADDITLAPIRAGVGLRLGANVGYLSYSRKRHILPF